MSKSGQKFGRTDTGTNRHIIIDSNCTVLRLQLRSKCRILLLKSLRLDMQC